MARLAADPTRSFETAAPLLDTAAQEGQQQMGASAFDLKRKLTQPAAPPRHSFFRSRKLRAVECAGGGARAL